MFIAIFAAIFIGMSMAILGSGGAILTVPLLVYVFEQPEKLAIASSLLIVAVIAGFNLLPRLFNKQIDWKLAITFSIFSSLGTKLGVSLAEIAMPWLQMLLFSIITAIAALRLITTELPTAKITINYWKVIISAILIGITTGFVGVGGGFLIVPVLIILANLNLASAVSSSLLIIFINAIYGFSQYQKLVVQLNLDFNWQLIGLISFFGLIGSFFAQPLGARLPAKVVKMSFAYLLLIVSAGILLQTSVSLL
ncbi:sulfite exporter TauE/SafE family protein [Catenovulum maritimum]|uniref:Probable membrane transporter protein n=1 Tax=Catenovulum maritimum TaxID=1513271 RepID=A0A0J8GSB7_9ALTE|nr:sulfite exporter TauE/SafE family protein [Catenovulum maritimum]KMT65695.1 hypothetical protein XM47_08355 [Catenovulum maritimum]